MWLNMKNILKSKVIREPFDHYIVDDFLIGLDWINSSENIDERKRWGLEIDSPWKFLFPLDNILREDVVNNMDIIFKKFEKYKQTNTKNYEVLTGFTFTEPGTVYPTHEDSNKEIAGKHFKGIPSSFQPPWTSVVYLWPITGGDGTVLYKDGVIDKKVEWKHNRALVFCPGVDATYHSFENTTDKLRITLNINIVSYD